jgi:glycerol kinase
MPGSRYVIAVDQGTTNTKAVMLDKQGQVQSRASKPVNISFPRAGWVEQDANEIWNTAKAVLAECLKTCEPHEVAGIGITNQRESVVVWQRDDGTPVSKCISWQCQRSAELCQRLKSSGIGGTVLSRTGLRLDPMFSASKLAWVLESDRELRASAEAGDLCAGTIDSWLLWNLTKDHIHACDASNASRTQLCKIRNLEWDDELLSTFRIPRSVLPAIYSSNALFGETRGEDGIPPGIPICGVLGDSHAALFAHAAFHPGVVKATYGTGSSLMSPAAFVRATEHISSTVAWALNGHAQYALEGNIFATGAAVQWVGKFLGLKSPVQEASRLAMQVPDSDGIYFVPALAGLGAPHWNEKARGVISGLTQASTAAHLARATIDSIAFQVRDVLEAMERSAEIETSELLADGGATENDLLMQVQADIIGRPVLRSASRDLSAQGAAWMAGLGSGFWLSLDELEAIPQKVVRFEPRLSERERENKYAQWTEAVARVLGAATASGASVHGV